MYRKQNKKSVALLLGALVTLGTASAIYPTRVQAQPAQIKVGVVDESKVGDEYTKLKDTLARYDTLAQTLQTQLNGRLMLTDEEGKQFDQLIMKDNPSTDDQAALKKLVDTGTGRFNENQGLVGKATRTDAENARMKELQNIAQQAQVSSERIEDALLSKIKEKQKKEVDALVSAADDVISQVANAKGLTVVFRKDAVVWNAPSVDITADVLKQLNGK